MGIELEIVRRNLHSLQLYAGIISVVVAVAMLGGIRTDGAKDQSQRARPIAIADEAGHGGRLIGAQIPAAENRMRTNSACVRAIVVPRFPKEYLEWCKEHRHSVNGMLASNEKGLDVVAVGDSFPDPNAGRRIGSSSCISINGTDGFERSRYDLRHVGSHDRMVLGLDDAHGRNGVALMVMDSGNVGIVTHGGKETIYIGSAAAGDGFTGSVTALT